MLSIPRVIRDQVWYKQSSFYNSNFSIPNKSASLFGRVFLEEISSKMTLVQGRRRLHQECPSVAPFIVFFNSISSSKLGDKLSDQPIGPSKTKSPIAIAPVTVTNIPKYSKNNLQRILKAVLETWAPTLTLLLAPTPAPVVSKTSWEKFKAHSPDVYCKKSHMDCYNFCQ